MDLGERFFLCREEALEVAFPLHPRMFVREMREKRRGVATQKRQPFFFSVNLLETQWFGHDNSEL